MATIPLIPEYFEEAGSKNGAVRKTIVSLPKGGKAAGVRLHQREHPDERKKYGSDRTSYSHFMLGSDYKAASPFFHRLRCKKRGHPRD